MNKPPVAGFTTPPASGERERPPRVLLVDDDPVVLRALGRLLTEVRSDWTFDMVESSEAAMRLLQEESYDVVVTDLQMPGRDGAWLLGHLASAHPMAWRLVHSSHVGTMDAHARQLAHGFVRKPAHVDELVFALEWALERRRGAESLALDGVERGRKA
ncbi:MAG: response regulator [Myxococcales bacterium]